MDMTMESNERLGTLADFNPWFQRPERLQAVAVIE